jgi:hypothetical protein
VLREEYNPLPPRLSPVFNIDTDQLASVLDAAHAIAEHLATMREQISEQDWEAICETPQIGPLLLLAMDLEHSLDESAD